ncbi:MAG: V-type ATP synthase subunit D [Candidatus Hydrogenedentes bacterium]|nr:V-type ATP synthase subunit D [Candidatus Hydrogenedentota bacterium]
MATRLAVNPTRMELLRLRKRLVVARRGHKLLKDKLDGLMKEFLELARKYKELRERVDEQLPAILRQFVLAEVTSSGAVVEDALLHMQQEMSIDIGERRIMGVPVPQFTAHFGTPGAYSLVQTPTLLDSASAELRAFLPKLLQLAESEQAVLLLAQEIEKTRRRVNALEHNMIPRLLTTVRYITSKLDETERSNISRLMKIKAQRLAQEQ